MNKVTRTHTIKAPDIDGATWIKSSHSGSGGNCVEMADVRVTHDSIAVRDSKDPEGPALTFSAGQWADFMAFAAGFEV